MLGYWYKDGRKVTIDVLRCKEFVTGNAKMQYASRGVVQLADGTVRTFGVLHHPDEFGHYHVVGDPLREAYESAVLGLREFEKAWITDELPEYKRDMFINPVTVKVEPGEVTD